MKGCPLPLSPKHCVLPGYGKGFAERVSYDMCWFQDRDIDVVKKWPNWLTVMHGIMNKYILRPSSQELFQRWHFFSFPNWGWCKGVECSLMYGELHSGTTMHHRGPLQIFPKPNLTPGVASPFRVCPWLIGLSVKFYTFFSSWGTL